MWNFIARFKITKGIIYKSNREEFVPSSIHLFVWRVGNKHFSTSFLREFLHVLLLLSFKLSNEGFPGPLRDTEMCCLSGEQKWLMSDSRLKKIKWPKAAEYRLPCYSWICMGKVRKLVQGCLILSQEVFCLRASGSQEWCLCEIRIRVWGVMPVSFKVKHISHVKELNFVNMWEFPRFPERCPRECEPYASVIWSTPIHRVMTSFMKMRPFLNL